MEVREIVEKYLETNGYDGLFSPYECACKRGDLMPCESDVSSCEPGYLQPEGNEEEYLIGPTKHV